MLTRNTYHTIRHVTRIKGRHADASGAPEGQPRRKVEVERPDGEVFIYILLP